MKKRILFGILILFLSFAACSSREPITNFADVNGTVIGSVNASVKIYEYTDYACPYCKEADAVVYDLIKKYGNQIMFQHKDLIIHPQAYVAAEAAQCAADQNRFWDYNEVLFANQDALSNLDLNRYAIDLGLNNTQFGLCLLEHQKKDIVEADIKEIENLWVKNGGSLDNLGTPVFVINGQIVPGYRSINDYSQIIDKELKK